MRRRFRSDFGVRSLSKFHESHPFVFGHNTVTYEPAESVEMLVKSISVDNLLFGTDRPANGDSMDPTTGHPFNDVKWYLEEIESLSDEDRAKIFEGNIRKVFSRFPDLQAAAR